MLPLPLQREEDEPGGWKEEEDQEAVGVVEAAAAQRPWTWGVEVEEGQRPPTLVEGAEPEGQSRRPWPERVEEGRGCCRSRAEVAGFQRRRCWEEEEEEVLGAGPGGGERRQPSERRWAGQGVDGRGSACWNASGHLCCTGHRCTCKKQGVSRDENGKWSR